MNRAEKRSRARLGGLLALALGVAALLAIPVVSAAQNGDDDGPGHHRHHGEKRHHHHRHHGDREVAGTIASFDPTSGRLTIETRGGDSISGLVDDSTKIKCEDQSEVGHDDNGTGANCTTADLVSGGVVQEADLEIEHGSARFDDVELAH